MRTYTSRRARTNANGMVAALQELTHGVNPSRTRPSGRNMDLSKIVKYTRKENAPCSYALRRYKISKHIYGVNAKKAMYLYVPNACVLNRSANIFQRICCRCSWPRCRRWRRLLPRFRPKSQGRHPLQTPFHRRLLCDRDPTRGQPILDARTICGFHAIIEGMGTNL